MKRTRLFPRWIRASAAALFALLLTTSFAAAQSESIIYRFEPTTASGVYPEAALIADKAGNLYGTTSQGGSSGDGAVYQITPRAAGGGARTVTMLHEFASGADGADPLGPLTFDTAGNLFGTTLYGGVGVNGNSYGTVFELSPPAAPGGSWTYAVIASFDSGIVAKYPLGGLIFDQDGNLYGISDGGPPNSFCGETGASCGNVFQLQPPSVHGGPWTGTSIYDFMPTGTTDGVLPTCLVLGQGGVLYGTASYGG